MKFSDDTQFDWANQICEEGRETPKSLSAQGIQMYPIAKGNVGIEYVVMADLPIFFYCIH